MSVAAHPLIERADDLTALLGVVARARAGEGASALVQADAGLGKSRLLAELRARAADDEVRVMHARASQLEQGFAFGVVRTLLAGPVRAMKPAARERLLTGATAPAAVALGLGDGDELRAVQPSPSLLDAIHWLVDGLCADGPVVLVVDDAQWADGPSLRALAYLAHRADSMGLALVCAQRPARDTADPQATAALARSAAPSLSLAPLSSAGVAELAAAATGQRLDAAAVDALVVATQGSPFLVSQVVAELAAFGPQGLGRGTAISPAALRGVIAGRLSELPAEAREVARTVSVLGDDAHVRDVAGLTGLADERVLQASGALIEAGIFTDGTELSFAHPLLADAVDAELSAADRALANLRAARWLAAHEAGPERVAVHLGRSAPSGDAEAVRQLRAAAGDALRRGAPEVAVTHLRRALAEPPAVEELVATTVELGLAELAVGSDADATTHLAPVLDDPSWPAGHAAAAAWARLGQGGYDGAIDALLRGAQARRGRDDDAAVWLSGIAEWMNFFVPVPERRVVTLPPPETLTGATPAERMALAAYLAGHTSELTAEEAAALAERALGQGGLSADAGFHGAMFASGPLMGLLYAERLDAAEPELARVEQQALEQAADGSLAARMLPLTFLRLLRGDVATAATEAVDRHETPAILRGPAKTAYDTFVTALQVLALLAHAGPQEAERLLEERGLAGPLEPMQIWAVPVRAHVHLAAGRTDAALGDAMVWGQTVAFIGDPISPVEYHTAEALALAAAGRQEEALAAADRELARARAWGASGRIAALLRTRAELAPQEGEVLLDEALELALASPLPLEQARVRLARGLMLRRAGSRTAARAELEQALQLGARCQAGPLTERAMAELRVLGARPRRMAVDGVEALTRSERRVADLAAAGSTNREIAQELFVTVKTVDSHLSRVYRKLDITGRGELPRALQPEG